MSARNSNPGRLDGRHRWIHWVMAAPLHQLKPVTKLESVLTSMFAVKVLELNQNLFGSHQNKIFGKIDFWIPSGFIRHCFFNKNGPTPTSSSFIFDIFNQTLLQFLQQINMKKCHVHSVNSARIQTHNLRNMSLLP